MEFSSLRAYTHYILTIRRKGSQLFHDNYRLVAMFAIGKSKVKFRRTYFNLIINFSKIYMCASTKFKHVVWVKKIFLKTVNKPYNARALIYTCQNK